MLVNEKIALHTNKIVLVPYCVHHVRKYHEWMKDPDIQAATASEPLCLADEYKMQQTWRADNDKLTFITCLPHSNRDLQAEVDSMIGDANLFVLVNEEENGDVSLVGEIELMIAKRDNQKHGLGRAALLVFLRYVLRHQGKMLKEFFDSPRDLAEVSKFAYLRAKIKESNARSIALFESLDFKKTEVSPNFFDEFELRNGRLTLEQIEQWMEERDIKNYEEVPYCAAPYDSRARESVGSGSYSVNSSQI